MAASIAVVISVDLWTILRHVIPNRELACAKKMWKGDAARSANPVSSTWTLKISLVVRHASVMGIHQIAKRQLATPSYR